MITKKRISIEQLKKQFRERLEAKNKEPKIKPKPPRYDNVFYEGVKTLDALAGKDIQTMD